MLDISDNDWYNQYMGGGYMKRKYVIQCFFALAYSALGSLAFLYMDLGLSMDIAIYPHLKPFMLAVAILAALACLVVLIIDIRRKSVVRFRVRLIILLVILIATVNLLIQFWGFLALIAGY